MCDKEEEEEEEEPAKMVGFKLACMLARVCVV